MKKKILAAVILVLVMSAAAVFAVFGNKKSPIKSPVQQSNQSTQTTYGSQKICDLFTLEDAKKMLGNNAQQAPANANPEIKTDSLSITSCSYGSGKATFKVTALSSLGLVLRSPLNEKGAKLNQTDFDSRKTKGTKIDGYGDVAYWIANSGEFNVLKNGTWLSITVTATSPGTGRTKTQAIAQIKTGPGTLEDAKKVADIILAKI